MGVSWFTCLHLGWERILNVPSSDFPLDWREKTQIGLRAGDSQAFVRMFPRFLSLSADGILPSVEEANRFVLKECSFSSRGEEGGRTRTFFVVIPMGFASRQVHSVGVLREILRIMSSTRSSSKRHDDDA